MVRVMSGVSIVVVGLSLRASRHPSDTALGVQPAGVVDGAQADVSSAPTTAVDTRPASTAAPAPRTTKAPTAQAPVPTRPSPTAVPRRAAPATPTVTKSATAPAPATTAPAKTVTVNGTAVDTRYGPVQVQIDVRSGRIVAARALEYPTDSGRDQEINSQAVPQLEQETLQANSAQIDTVSGATYTSDGYRSSLQSAIDAATRAGAR